jgi:hypothetical protein
MKHKSTLDRGQDALSAPPRLGNVEGRRRERATLASQQHRPASHSETEGKCVQVILLNVRSELSGHNFFWKSIFTD